MLANLLPIKISKAKVKMNETTYLGLSILEISKKLMYEFLYDHIKPKYKNNAELCQMDTDIFILHINTKDVSKYIAYDAKRTFDTSILWNWEAANWVEREIWLMKDELSEKIMMELVGLKLKTYSYIKMALLMTKKLREQRNV